MESPTTQWNATNSAVKTIYLIIFSGGKELDTVYVLIITELVGGNKIKAKEWSCHALKRRWAITQTNLWKSLKTCNNHHFVRLSKELMSLSRQRVCYYSEYKLLLVLPMLESAATTTKISAANTTGNLRKCGHTWEQPCRFHGDFYKDILLITQSYIKVRHAHWHLFLYCSVLNGSW